MHQLGFIAAILAASATLCRATVSTYGRIEPTGDSSGVAGMKLLLHFEADAGEQLVYFGLDLTATDGSLTASGADYSHFSFAKKSPLLDGWDQIPGANFGPNPFLSTAEFETVTNPLPSVTQPGSYELGTLFVNYAAAGLTAFDPRKISLAGVDTVIGTEIPGSPGTFKFQPVVYTLQTVVSVPEGGNVLAPVTLLFGSFAILRFCSRA
jgi:hypothetical protein